MIILILFFNFEYSLACDQIILCLGHLLRIPDDFVAFLYCYSAVVYILLAVNVRLYGAPKHFLICICFRTQLLKMSVYRFSSRANYLVSRKTVALLVSLVS